jgi:hypothetical protein
MTITADPLSVATEVAYRRESMMAGLGHATPSRRHTHRWVPRLQLRVGHRHAGVRPA